MTADSDYACMSAAYCGTEFTGRSIDIVGGATSITSSYDSRSFTVCKRALLKKVKTNRNKFFVLHKTSSSVPARLEYYDSESQWNKQKKPKRTIYLQTCFSVNAFSDTSVKYGLTLYTKDDSFQIGFSSEQERDMWLADISFLSRANCELARDPVQHKWRVKISTRNMSCPFCGQYFLLLDRRQATLFRKSDTAGALTFPLDVITRTDHNNNFFIMEVNENADTGPGEVWMELEDSLIAKHVHRAFTQNISANEEEFRPVSKSLSYKDRRSAFSVRIRSGSDAKISRSGTKQSLIDMGQKNSLLMSSNVSIRPHRPRSRTLYARSHQRTCSSLTLKPSNYLQRDRSDSIDSHGTSVSVSTDESEQSCRGDRHCTSRSVTPDPRSDSRGRKGADNYKSLTHPNEDFSDLSYNCHTSQDSNSNLVYMDMTAGSALTQQQSSLMPNSGYMDMTCGRRSPGFRGYKPKPDVVKSYLIEDEEDSPQPERRHNSVGSRVQANQVLQRDNEYVEMCRNPLADKCSSAPHLNPMTLSHKFLTIDDPQHLVDNRQQLYSFDYSHRPRGSSWSQCTRPYTDKKTHSKRPHRSQQTKSQYTDYIDMTCGSKANSSYVEMCLNNKNSRIPVTTKAAREDKENRIPQSNRSQVISEPFPELSASSEDDVSLHSMEGSVSLYSLTSSGDSMSMSSHSPSHCAVVPSTTEADNSILAVSRSSVRISQRSLQVPSFIRDDACSDYLEVSPGNSTK